MKGTRVARIRRTLIAMVALALTTSACGKGGAPPDELSFDFFQDARPVYEKPAGRLTLVAPKKGQEPAGEVGSQRDIERTFGPHREVRLGHLDGGPSINVQAAERETGPGRGTPTGDTRTVDVNGNEAIALELGNLRVIAWETDSLSFSVSGTGDEEPMIDVARGIRHPDSDPRNIRVTSIPDGYEVAESQKIEGGRVMMAGLAYNSVQGDDPSMLMIMSMFSETVEATQMSEISGVDRPDGMEQVNVRGADAILFSYSFDAGGEDAAFESTFLMWRERPDVMVMMTGFGGTDANRMREIAETLHEVSREEWDDRFPEDDRYFGGFK